ncbi:MAG: hypothetical protein FGF50_11680, partial [Candidatus Brockarchaeota archaeon]|nr:hypothetical protein [Candidatus Brockarchaeota archaeon]
GIIHLNQYYNDDGTLTRTLRVFKMRGTSHEIKIRKYIITDKGVEIL